MTREEEIRSRYERELASMRREQSECNHDWDEVKYDPEIKKEPSDWKYEGAGSDKWPVATGYRTVEVKRWSRTCKCCGKVEYTNEQVAVRYEPEF